MSGTGPSGDKGTAGDTGKPSQTGRTGRTGKGKPGGTSQSEPGGTSQSEPGERSTWTIAQMAEEFAITHRTVRHYEDLNLISPERRGTSRIYHRRERTRLNLIMRGRRLGFPLEEIRTIIDLYDEPRGRAGQLSYVLDQIHERRADLERRRLDIDDALSELEAFESRCRSDLGKLHPGGKGLPADTQIGG